MYYCNFHQAQVHLYGIAMFATGIQNRHFLFYTLLQETQRIWKEDKQEERQMREK